MAHGACVQAAVLAQKPNAPSIYVRNVTPLTIDSKTEQQCYTVIERNTQYPTEKVIYGKTIKNNQVKATITIFEGEHESKDENEVLGSMTLKELTPSPKGNETIKISLKLNDKGIISATAVDQRTKKAEMIRIDRPELFTKDEIENLKTYHNQLKMVDPKTQIQAIDSCTKFKRMKLEPKKQFEIKCPIYGKRNIISSSQIQLGE